MTEGSNDSSSTASQPHRSIFSLVFLSLLCSAAAAFSWPRHQAHREWLIRCFGRWLWQWWHCVCCCQFSALLAHRTPSRSARAPSPWQRLRCVNLLRNDDTTPPRSPSSTDHQQCCWCSSATQHQSTQPLLLPRCTAPIPCASSCSITPESTAISGDGF